jgi:hypothetical protein
MNERQTRRRGPLLWLAGKTWRWWAVMLLLLPVPYIVSFGPVCWWFKEIKIEANDVEVNIAPTLYWPLGWLAENGPEPLPDAINWYGTLGVYWVHVPTNSAGTHWMVLVQGSSLSREIKPKYDLADEL